jgi:hypothetical protein
VWVCSCEAGEKGIFHRHTATLAVIERAAELETAHDEEATALERATMGRRLCAARRQYQEV